VTSETGAATSHAALDSCKPILQAPSASPWLQRFWRVLMKLLKSKEAGVP
jgi:hypothetical protein